MNKSWLWIVLALIMAGCACASLVQCQIDGPSIKGMPACLEAT